MVAILCIFLPLLAAFVNAWLAPRSSTISRIVSFIFLAAGFTAALLLTVRLDAWDLTDLERSETLSTGVGVPPVSIDLNITAGGALAALVIYAASMMALIRISAHNVKAQPLLLALVTASLGLLFSTDLFNSFVFLEIGSIITIGLAAACKCDRRWEVAVKVALVSGLLTILYLIAVAVVYRYTGELRFEALSALRGVPAMLVASLLLTVIATEIKAFPLSGWGLDFYEGTSPILAGTYSATWSLAVLLWASRLLPLLPMPDLRVLAWIGAAGLVLGQLGGLRAVSPGRMLGYSTAAYASILLVLAGTVTGESYTLLVLLMMSFAAISKFGLFMLGDSCEKDRWKGKGTLLLLLPVLALTGIPPLPVFWVKVRMLGVIAGESPVLFATVMTGLFIEAVYLFRMWATRSRSDDADTGAPSVLSHLASGLLVAGGIWLTIHYWPHLDFSGDVLGSQFLTWLFTGIFGVGTLMALPGVFNRVAGERGYWVWMLLSGAAAVMLPRAGNGITFYLLWEVSAFAAVVGVSRGNRAAAGTFWFAVFAGASGYMLLASVLLSGSGLAVASLPALLAVGAALLKMGQGGSHLWNVRAYSAAPGTLPAFLAGTSSKAAALLLFLAAESLLAGVPAGRLLAWVGVLTALCLAVMAALSSDYKKVLAYASVSQLGYIVAGIGLASVLGWTAAMYHTLHHFLFKTVLFLGAAGVIYRTGTSSYDRLGGLVRRMPLTFAFTLIAVISFAGVPPLAGFGGKWLLYNGFIEAGWLPAAVVAMFASVVAFLYAFRLLHAVFLGQLSPRYARVREAPLTLLLPQAILVGGIMTLSFRPTILLDRLVPAVSSIAGLRGAAPVIDGTNVISALGNWNAWTVGIMVMGLFGFAFLFYWLSGHRPTHVGQLDIGFSGELPPSAEEVHYAGNFFRPYSRALAFLPRIHAGKVFSAVVYGVMAAGDAVRSIFTGDARTYLAHTVIFLILFFIFSTGGI